MKTLSIMSASLMLLCGSVAAAGASTYRGNDGPTLVWVTIKKLPSEGLWQACRRVYQRDVYIVLQSGSTKVRCKVDHSRIYQYGERRQNFNN